MPLVAERKLIRINVTPTAKRVITDWAGSQDMTEIGVASRIYEWFGRQPEPIQRAILGLYGDLTPDIATALLVQFSKQSKSKRGAKVGSVKKQWHILK